MIEFGGIVFWSLLTLLCIVEVLTLKADHPIAFIIPIVTVVLGFWLVDHDQSFRDLLVLSPLYVGGYFLASIIWVWPWFYLKVTRIRDVVANIKTEYMKMHNEFDPRQFECYLIGTKRRDWWEDRYKLERYPFTVGDLKSSIILNMVFWPFSIVETVIGEIVYKGWMRLYRKISNTLQSMINRIMRNDEMFAN